jgi:hypothetical protein
MDTYILLCILFWLHKSLLLKKIKLFLILPKEQYVKLSSSFVARRYRPDGPAKPNKSDSQATLPRLLCFREPRPPPLARTSRAAARPRRLPPVRRHLLGPRPPPLARISPAAPLPAPPLLDLGQDMRSPRPATV